MLRLPSSATTRYLRDRTAVSWNPYVAAAKFVVHQAQGEDSLQLLADQIAQKILDERQNLLMHDALPGGGSNH
jgi:hypothetical protein